MGSCLACCCGESKSQSVDPEERARLISDPVSSNDGQTIPSETVATSYQQALPSKTDEQSMLNKILQQTAMNVIDISTLGPHMMEQNEYLERRSAYTTKVESVSQLWNYNRDDYSQLEDVADPILVLSESPINNDDYILINVAAAKIRDAVADIKVNHTEDLVVPFHIPQKRIVSSPATLSDSHHSEDSELTTDQS